MLELAICPYTGLPFHLGTNNSGSHRHPFAPSLHRIVPELGYVPGNVIVITWMANNAISEFGEEAFEDFAFQYLKFKRPDLIVEKPKRRRADNDNTQLDMFEAA